MVSVRRPNLHLLSCCALIISAPPLVRADTELINAAHVTASQYGNCYLKSIPSATLGQVGTTRVYRVANDNDVLIETFNWYSRVAFIDCAPGDSPNAKISVVRVGPWPRGDRARAEDLSIAFYYGGEPVREYSTLDLAGSPENVSRTVSHYKVVSRIEGYVRSDGPLTFVLWTTDGRRLAFDPATGVLEAAKTSVRR